MMAESGDDGGSALPGTLMVSLHTQSNKANGGGMHGAMELQEQRCDGLASG